jgi:hypothetical protein
MGRGASRACLWAHIRLLALGGNSSVNPSEFGALQYQRYQGMRLLKGLTPTVCGGGVFGYAGAAGSYKGAEGFAGRVAQTESP